MDRVLSTASNFDFVKHEASFSSGFAKAPPSPQTAPESPAARCGSPLVQAHGTRNACLSHGRSGSSEWQVRWGQYRDESAEVIPARGEPLSFANPVKAEVGTPQRSGYGRPPRLDEMSGLWLLFELV